MANKKYSVLAVLDVLQKQSDKDHPMYLKEIRYAVRDMHGIDISEKTIRSDLQALKDFGFDIRYRDTFERTIEHGDGTTVDSNIKKDCYLVGPIEDDYIEVLFDALLSERYLIEADYRDIVQILEQMSSTKDFRLNAESAVRNRPDNSRSSLIYRNIRTVRNAIAKRKTITFIYEPAGTDKLQTPKQEERMLLSPYKVFSDNSIYYLSGYKSPFTFDDSRVILRIDGMKKIEIEKRPRITGQGTIEKQLLNRRFKLTEEDDVEGLCEMPGSLVGAAIDFFGNNKVDIPSYESGSDRENYMVLVSAPERALLVFALMNAPDVEIISPADLRAQIRNVCDKASERHSF